MDVNTFVNQFSDPEDDEENVPTYTVPEDDVPTYTVPDDTTPYVPYNKTPDVPTQLDVNMRTTSSDLITDYSGESMKIQGPIRGKKFKNVLPIAKLTNNPLQDVAAMSPNFECYIRGCQNDAHDKCVVVGCLCDNILEFCKEHLDYVKHQKLLFN